VTGVGSPEFTTLAGCPNNNVQAVLTGAKSARSGALPEVATNAYHGTMMPIHFVLWAVKTTIYGDTVWITLSTVSTHTGILPRKFYTSTTDTEHARFSTEWLA